MQELKQSESELTRFALSNGDVEYKRINRNKKSRAASKGGPFSL